MLRAVVGVGDLESAVGVIVVGVVFVVVSVCLAVVCNVCGLCVFVVVVDADVGVRCGIVYGAVVV